MTNRELFLEIGNIREEYIAEAEAYQNSKIRKLYMLKNPVIRKTISTAACLVICTGLIFTVQKMGITKDAVQESAIESIVPEIVEEMKDILTTEEIREIVLESAVEEKETDVKCENYQWDIASVKEKMEAYPDTYEEILKLDGVFVIVHGSVEKGKDIWEDFLEDVKNEKSSQIEIVRFTEEGAPIIESVYFDGNIFYLCVDNSRDIFIGNDSVFFEAEYGNIIKEETKQKDGESTIEYWLVSGENKYNIAYFLE